MLDDDDDDDDYNKKNYLKDYMVRALAHKSKIIGREKKTLSFLLETNVIVLRFVVCPPLYSHHILHNIYIHELLSFGNC